MLSMPSPTSLPLLTCLALSPSHTFPLIRSPACPFAASHPASTSPYPSIWCSQLPEKKYQLALHETEEGERNKRQLWRQRSANGFGQPGVFCWKAGDFSWPLSWDGGRSREGQEDRKWAARCRRKGDQVSDLDGTICCCCSWVPLKTPPPSPCAWLKDCGRWGALC